jgi:AcrR family transcriptional regulator
MAHQVSRDDYFRAALDILAARGSGALKVGYLCRSLGVTTGSFYHHFDSLHGFTDQLLASWEHDQTETYVALIAAAEPAVLAFEVLKEATLRLPHRAEAAIRTWSHLEPQVAAAQARVDAKRHEALLGVLARIIPDPERAERITTLGITLLIGFQQAGQSDSEAVLTGLLEEYERIIGYTRAALDGHP